MHQEQRPCKVSHQEALAGDQQARQINTYPAKYIHPICISLRLMYILHQSSVRTLTVEAAESRQTCTITGMLTSLHRLGELQKHGNIDLFLDFCSHGLTCRPCQQAPSASPSPLHRRGVLPARLSFLAATLSDLAPESAKTKTSRTLKEAEGTTASCP